MADEFRRRVLDSIADKRIPAGGPSDAAAHNLIAELAPGYFERWASEAAERIRAQPIRCCCAPRGWPVELQADGRCGRCWGVP